MFASIISPSQRIFPCVRHACCTIQQRQAFAVRCLSAAGGQVSAGLPTAARRGKTKGGNQKKAARQHRKRLDVAIVGLPNAGKSQLLNALTNSNVAAVSRKRHTTREGILGARTVKDTQLMFVDTPGFLRKRQARREGADRGVVGSASEDMKDIDFTLLVVDAARNMTQGQKETVVQLMAQALKAEGRLEFGEDEEEGIGEDEEEGMAESVADESSNDPGYGDGQNEGYQKFAVVMNKMDLVRPKTAVLSLAIEVSFMAEELLKISYVKDRNATKKEDVTADEGSDGDGDELDPMTLAKLLPTFFYTSALKGDGVDDLLQFLLRRATPCDSWEVSPGEVTPLSHEERVEELIREKIYRCMHKEVPHQIRQENEMIKVLRDRDGAQGILIHQNLIVRTKSHKTLLSANLQRIQEAAQRDLRRMFECNVALHLHVKLPVSKNRRQSSL